MNARGNSGATSKHYAVRYGGTTVNPTGLTAGGNLFLANGTGGVLGLYNGTDRTTITAWQAATGQDATSAVGDPLFVAPTGTSATVDLHLQTSNPAESGGTPLTDAVTKATVTLADDFDGQTRSTLTPADIGADAGNFTSSSGDIFAPGISYPLLTSGSTANRTLNGWATITDGVGVSGGASAPRLYFKKSTDADVFGGNTAADNGWKYVTATGSGPYSFTLDYSIINGGSVSAGNTVQYFVVAQDAANNLGSSPAQATASANPPVQNVNAKPGAGVNSFSILGGTISGTKTVGTGGDYPSLTGAGGLFAALNSSVLTGNVVVTITSDTTEDGSVTLSEFASAGFPFDTYTLTIQPDSATMRTISGTATAGLITLNGADRVTIDGRSGGSGRYLTFRNTNTGTSSSTILFQNGATSNTVRNCVLEGASTATLAGVVRFTTTTSTGNNSNLITGCQIRDLSTSAGVPATLIVNSGTSGVNNSGNTIANNELFNFTGSGMNIQFTGSANWTITGNTIYQTATRTTTLSGIIFGSIAGTSLLADNTIRDLATSATGTSYGIFFGSGTGTTVARNRIYNLSAGNGNLTGIFYNGSTGSTGTFANNFVSLTSTGLNQVLRGLHDQGAGGVFNAYYNTILIGGTGSGTNDTWAYTHHPQSFATLRNNIFFNARTGGGNHYAAGGSITIGTMSTDYNLFVGTGTNAANFFDSSSGLSATGTPISYAQWQTNMNGDSHSSASNPGGDYSSAMFVDAATGDLHIVTAGNPLVSNTGTPVSGITTDYDNDTRSTTTPDIGADELTNDLVVAVTGSMGGGAYTNVTINSGVTATFTSNLTVTGTLTLNGVIDTNGNTLSLTNCSASALTGGSASAYVRGSLTRCVQTGAAFTFPVADGSNNYAPFSLTPTTLTGTTNFTVNTTTGRPGTGLTNSQAINRTWNLTAGGALTADLAFTYLAADDDGGIGAANVTRALRWNGSSFTNFSGTALGTTVTVTGVNSFSPWGLGGPSAPTAVALMEFAAAPKAGGGAVVKWRTGYEADNVGFNVYRAVGSERLKLTPGMVAGSALLAARKTVLTAGNAYQWTDAGGTAGAGYWLEEVDLSGARTWYGPVYASGTMSAGSGGTLRREEAGVAAEANTTDVGDAPLLDELNARAGRDTQVEDVAQAETTPEADDELLQAKVAAAAPWTLPNQVAAKIAVRQDGWYRVTAAELQAAGFNPNINPVLFQLFSDGVEVPLRTTGVGNALTSLEFYGRGLTTPTGNERVYWLTTGNVAGLRWPVQPGGAAQTANTASFLATVERADKLIYFSGLLNGDAENWFGPVITQTGATQTLTTRFVDRAATATLEVTLQGVTDQLHAVNVEWNGQYVGTLNFNGKQRQTAQFTLPAQRVLTGANEIRCSSQVNGSDISLLERVRLTYARGFVAENNALSFRLNAGQSAVISGFSSPAIRLLELNANGAAARELTVTAALVNGSYGFAFQSAASATYLAVADAQLARAAAVKLNTVSNWRATTNGAELVIVAHRDFWTAANRLVTMRRVQGLRVALVDVEDAYDEFNFGAKSPQAVKDLLTMARTTWAVKPKFALLIGDATTDPRDYLGLGNADFVPTKLGATTYFETALDNWLADADGDGLPELALGRLPVRTSAQADALVTKILAFKASATAPRPGLLVSDRTVDGVNYRTQSTQYATALLPLMQKHFINRNDGAPDQVRAQILNSINLNKPLVVNWSGHGSTQVWTGDGLLRTQDAASLTNTATSLFVLATCLNGYFPDPTQTSLSEALLLNPTAGAFAVVAASGLNTPPPQHAFNQTLYQHLFAQGKTLGEALTAARQAAGDKDVRNSFVLLGDPTMKLR